MLTVAVLPPSLTPKTAVGYPQSPSATPQPPSPPPPANGAPSFPQSRRGGYKTTFLTDSWWIRAETHIRMRVRNTRVVTRVNTRRRTYLRNMCHICRGPHVLAGPHGRHRGPVGRFGRGNPQAGPCHRPPPLLPGPCALRLPTLPLALKYTRATRYALTRLLLCHTPGATVPRRRWRAHWTPGPSPAAPRPYQSQSEARGLSPCSRFFRLPRCACRSRAMSRRVLCCPGSSTSSNFSSGKLYTNTPKCFPA